MGKSAKVHKRVPKRSKSSSSKNPSQVALAPSSSSSSHIQVVQSTKKRAKLKAKAISTDQHSAITKTSGTGSNPSKGVLGNADYVSLLMGGRRKAKEEALKLPQKYS